MLKIEIPEYKCWRDVVIDIETDTEPGSDLNMHFTSDDGEVYEGYLPYVFCTGSWITDTGSSHKQDLGPCIVYIDAEPGEAGTEPHIYVCLDVHFKDTQLTNVYEGRLPLLMAECKI